MLMVIDPEKRVAKDHPLRRIKQLAEEALAQLSPVFDEIYSMLGRRSIPPERLLKASLLMADENDGRSAPNSISRASESPDACLPCGGCLQSH
jgi:hypothetical protein